MLDVGCWTQVRTQVRTQVQPQVNQVQPQGQTPTNHDAGSAYPDGRHIGQRRGRKKLPFNR